MIWITSTSGKWYKWTCYPLCFLLFFKKATRRRRRGIIARIGICRINISTFSPSWRCSWKLLAIVLAINRITKPKGYERREGDLILNKLAVPMTAAYNNTLILMKPPITKASIKNTSRRSKKSATWMLCTVLRRGNCERAVKSTPSTLMLISIVIVKLMPLSPVAHNIVIFAFFWSFKYGNIIVNTIASANGK